MKEFQLLFICKIFLLYIEKKRFDEIKRGNLQKKTYLHRIFKFQLLFICKIFFVVFKKKVSYKVLTYQVFHIIKKDKHFVFSSEDVHFSHQKMYNFLIRRCTIFSSEDVHFSHQKMYIFLIRRCTFFSSEDVHFSHQKMYIFGGVQVFVGN